MEHHEGTEHNGKGRTLRSCDAAFLTRFPDHTGPTGEFSRRPLLREENGPEWERVFHSHGRCLDTGTSVFRCACRNTRFRVENCMKLSTAPQINQDGVLRHCCREGEEDRGTNDRWQAAALSGPGQRSSVRMEPRPGPTARRSQVWLPILTPGAGRKSTGWDSRCLAPLFKKNENKQTKKHSGCIPSR